MARIFVASTASDLSDYRAKVRETIARMHNVAIEMEDFNSAQRPSVEACLAQVGEVDAMVVIVGHTYGAIPPESVGKDDRSYAWREAAEAFVRQKRVFAFVLDTAVRGSAIEQDGSAQRLAEFRQFLESKGVVQKFSTLHELAASVATALGKWERERADARLTPAPVPPASGVGLALFQRLRTFATAPRFLLLFLLLLAWSFGFAWRNAKLGVPTLDNRKPWTVGKWFIDLHWSWTVADGVKLFDQLTSAGLQRFYAVTELTLDGIYPLLYGLFFVMLLARFVSARFRWLLVIPLLTVVADYTENGSIAYAFLRNRPPLGVLNVARLGTTAKWSLLVLTGLVIVIAMTIYLRWLRERNWKRAERLGIPTEADPHMTDLNGVLERELDYVQAHRHPTRPRNEVRRNLVGLALSGGGIRSATTNLGVLQALSRMNILPMVDYISTVSGGGYIGACLSSLLSWNGRVAKPKLNDLCAPYTFKPSERPVFATDWKSFPFRAEIRKGMSRVGGDIVGHLRTHGNFMIARLGVFRRETMRSIGTLLTGIVYHVLLFITTLFAISTLYLTTVLAAAPDAGKTLSDSTAKAFRESVAAADAQKSVERTSLVAIDSTVKRNRTDTLTCPGCDVRTTLEPPTLWQRLRWNATVMTRVVARASSDLSAHPYPIPRKLWPIAGGLLAGILMSLGALVWMLFSLRAYLQGKDPDVARPRRGESEEDAFERRVLIRLGITLSLLFVVAIIVRVLVWKQSKDRFGSEDDLLWLFTPLAVALGARVSGFTISVLGQSYASKWKRRMRSLWGAFQAISIYGIWVTLLFAVLPLAIYALSDNTTAVGWSAVGSLIFTRLLTSRTAGANGASIAQVSRIPASLRNGLLGLGVTLVLILGLLYFDSIVVQHLHHPAQAAMLFAGAAIVFMTFAWSVNPNRLSPHYFYRDRLAETYLLSELPDNAGRIRLYRDAMEMPLHCLHGDPHPPEPNETAPPWRNTAPYHLVSAAINMAGSRDLTRKDRKSGYWLFSKLYCGSVHTGFRETKVYRNGETNVARAIAISGAAASSAMGRITFFAQAFATVLFNVRLGQWIENPGFPESQRGQEPAANWPSYLWREITTDTVETTRLVNLSDGGHTGDNVGIYPLLQRRCKVIIACDAEGDGSLTFGSFTEALRHAYVDMGIDVDIDLTMIRPDPATGRSRSHCAVGRIRYPDRPYQESFLIYLKNSLTGDEPEPVLNYKARNAAFPHETTADLFFDDAQFESYRALGVHIAEHTFARWVRSTSFSVAKGNHEPSPA